MQFQQLNQCCIFHPESLFLLLISWIFCSIVIITYDDLCHKDVVVKLLLDLCVYSILSVVATFRKQNCIKMPNKARGYLCLWYADLPLLCCRGSRGLLHSFEKSNCVEVKGGVKRTPPLFFIFQSLGCVLLMLFIYPVENIISQLPGFLKKFLSSHGPFY